MEQEILEKEISISEIMEALQKRWKMIALITLTCSVIAGVLSFFVIKPTYEASTKLFIGKEESQNSAYDNNDIQMYQKLLKTYAEMIKNDELIEKAIREVNTTMTANEILGSLTVNPLTDTQILEIKLQGKKPEEITGILNGINNEFIFQANELVPNGNVKIIREVRVPKDPIAPNKVMNIAIAFLLGLMVGVGLTFLLEYLDNTFKTKEAVEGSLNIPVMGVIPQMSDSSKPGKKYFVVEDDPKAVAAESYRTLKTNIQYSSFDEKHRVMVVTSSTPGEGKSTTTGNLALALAEGEAKVILIDCDMRKPTVHKKFHISNEKGLSDVLIGKVDIMEAAHKYNKNLLILTAGKIPPNPSEMLGSKTMKELLDRLKEVVDYIILDTPPVQAVADAQILSTRADGTLLVIKAGETKKEATENAINLLNKVNANVIGGILNGAEDRKNKTYYYYGE